MRVSSQPDQSNPYLSVPIPSSYMPHELLHNYYNSGHLTAWERLSIDIKEIIKQLESISSTELKVYKKNRKQYSLQCRLHSQNESINDKNQDRSYYDLSLLLPL